MEEIIWIVNLEMGVIWIVKWFWKNSIYDYIIIDRDKNKAYYAFQINNPNYLLHLK